MPQFEELDRVQKAKNKIKPFLDLNNLDLQGVPFSNIFTIDKVGLEYEIELAFFHDSFTPVKCYVRIVYIDESLYTDLGFSIIKQSKNKWILCRQKINTNRYIYVLYIDESMVHSLMCQYNYSKYKIENDEIVDNTVDNFEIRTNPHDIIQNAVNEAQYNYKIIVKILMELKIPRFVLLTSGFRIGDQNYISSSKHLNITLVYQDRSLVYKWITSNYPHYFKYIDDKVSGFGFKDGSYRLHIKLPYKFKDYNGFFLGNANLPNVEKIFNYQEKYRKKKKVFYSRNIDYKNCELVVLGYQTVSKWISCNNLV